jgi:hypothetical protein
MSDSASSSASIIETPVESDVNDVSSLTDSDVSSYSTTYSSDAEQEWEESLKQLELIMNLVVVPFIGKYVGRKCAYWGK